MAAIWTAPRTWVDGEFVTSALMNEQIRDNLEYLKALESSASVYFLADQALGNGVWSYRTWDTVDHDTGGFYSAGAQDRLTIPAAGRYVFGCQWTTNPGGVVTGGLDVRITLNDNALPAAIANTLLNFSRFYQEDVNLRRSQLSSLDTFAAGDVLRVLMWQNGGAGVGAAGTNTFGRRANGFWVARYGD